jgi:ribosomal protein L11 methyltransferase
MSKWAEICIQTTHEALEPVSNLLHVHGASGVVIEDAQDLDQKEWITRHGQLYEMELDPAEYPEDGVHIKAYYPWDESWQNTLDSIRLTVEGLRQHQIPLGRGNISIREVKEEDWANAWKQYYKPERISPSLTIVPTWESYTPVHTDEKIIRLDPGMAFGTGTHPTTVLCVQALERVVRGGDEVIDVGCGSGVLSIAALKLGARQALAVDIDDVAVKVAAENVELNGLQEHICVRRNHLLDDIEESRYDVIVANILAEVIMLFIKDAYRVVKPGGYFIASGIIEQKGPDVETALTEAGFEIKETNRKEHWLSIVCRRPTHSLQNEAQ